MTMLLKRAEEAPGSHHRESRQSEQLDRKGSSPKVLEQSDLYIGHLLLALNT
jgi:hypothetical protein